MNRASSPDSGRGLSAATTNITLSIGGRDYTVACAPGEEAHVTGLGRTIAGKLEAMPSNIALGEARALLFAALLLADELHELRQANAELAQPAPAIAAPAAGLGDKLGALARRLENIAAHLEQSPASA